MAERIDANVVIIGAGPAGTACAAHLGQLGVRDVLLLDRHDFPRDKTCGSGISPKGIDVLRELGVWNEVEPESYRIEGIRIVTPGGTESWQSAGSAVEAVVCQRRTLDHILLKKALSRGVKFRPNFNATELLTDGGRVMGVLGADGTRVHGRTTIVAGGTHCRLDGVERERRLFQAIMGWWEGVPFKPGHLEMVFDRMLGVGYGWLFPETESRVNIGIVYEDDTTDGQAVKRGGTPGGVKKENARELFQRFLDKHYGERVPKGTKIGGWKGHPVAWSYRIEKLTAPGRMTIGEAALLTHPATAEGIYQGMRSGMIAAESIADLRRGSVSEPEAWKQYERGVRRAFQTSFAVGGKLFRQMVRGRGLDLLIQATSNRIVQSATAKVMAGI